MDAQTVLAEARKTGLTITIVGDKLAVSPLDRVFPNAPSGLRLIRALAVETHENWIEVHRYLDMNFLREHRKKALMRLTA